MLLDIPISQEKAQNYNQSSAFTTLLQQKLFLSSEVGEIKLQINSNYSRELINSSNNLKASIITSQSFSSPLILSFDSLPKCILTNAIPINKLIKYLQEQTYLEYKRGIKISTSSKQQVNVIKVKPIGLRGGSESKLIQNEINSSEVEQDLSKISLKLMYDTIESNNLIRVRQYQKARDILKPWILESEEKFEKCDDCTKVRALNAYSNSFLSTNDHELAKVFIDRAFTILENSKSIPRDTLLYANTIESKGKYQMKRGRFSPAIELYEETLSIRMEKAGYIDSETSDSFFYIGICKLELGRYSEAKGDLESALQIKGKLPQSNELEIADIEGKLAKVYLEIGKYQLSFEYYMKVIRIELKVREMNTVVLKEYLYNAAIIYKKQVNLPTELIFMKKYSFLLNQLFQQSNEFIFDIYEAFEDIDHLDQNIEHMKIQQSINEI